MSTICMGDEDIEAVELIQDLRVEVWISEQQIAGLQDYVESRKDLVNWLLNEQN